MSKWNVIFRVKVISLVVWWYLIIKSSRDFSKFVLFYNTIKFQNWLLTDAGNKFLNLKEKHSSDKHISCIPVIKKTPVSLIKSASKKSFMFDFQAIVNQENLCKSGIFLQRL